MRKFSLSEQTVCFTMRYEQTHSVIGYLLGVESPLGARLRQLAPFGESIMQGGVYAVIQAAWWSTVDGQWAVAHSCLALTEKKLGVFHHAYAMCTLDKGLYSKAQRSFEASLGPRRC